ncbi:MAG: ERCC4-like helicase/ Hef nuclease [Promethearchaeota archaeon]|nr:MAG: ERCC4-like helicase/ Hef nuclease [Candidatus Lokiarchaeota archaeon]
MSSIIQDEKYISHPLLKEEQVLRREYQESIFINCLNKNCLVVIPTGLGKTIIALMLAVHRLTELKESKVIFLAPTKPLVEQHYKSFLDLTILPKDSLQPITGEISPDKRQEIWKETQVAFMTPQVLQNDIISDLYSIEDVSLVIFDECHRAVGNYAYCFIAQKYKNLSKDPQILGLTASPGSTEEKIREIKNNLFIEHIEIRTEKDADVKPYVHNVDNEWIKVKLPKEFSQVREILTEKLKTIYKWLKKNELLNSYDTTKVTRKDLLKLNKIINSRIAGTNNEDEKFQLFYAKKLQANAIRISHMLELIETQGINALAEYIEKNEEKIKLNRANKSLKELFISEDFKRAKNIVYKLKSLGIVHPKIEKLKEILHQQLQQNETSRILVFCHFRDSVNNIVSYFEDDSWVEAHKFVGQANKGSDKGLSQKEQISLLEEFKEGIYNTLIGTSVAEEGLDIAECDLVVFYDVVPSAIRAIQRRGRTGRKKEGKVYVLMAEGTRDEGYYWAEKVKEKKMKESLKKMKKSHGNMDSNQQESLMKFIKEEEKSKSEERERNDTCRKSEQKNKEKTEQEETKIQKIKDAGNFTIICDNRETASSVVRNMSLMGLNLKLEQLPVADYIISERIAIERKSAQDFNDSIVDGRLFSELKDLANTFERPILILEGDPFLISNINSNALYGAISSTIISFGVCLYKTKDPIETAEFLYQLARKEQQDKKGQIKLRFEKAPADLSHLLEYIIAGIPGVNTFRAKNLLRALKNLQNIINSDIGDLMKIEGIGKKIAQEIYKISRYDYKEET